MTIFAFCSPTDTGRDCDAHRIGNGFKDLFAKPRQRQSDKDETVDQDEHERVRISEAEAEADGIDEEGIQSHAARLCEREIGEQTDQHRADDGGDGGCNVDGAVGDTRRGEHIGVHHQDIDHGEEGRQTCEKFGFYGRAVLFQFEKLFDGVHFFFASDIFCRSPYLS